MAVNSVNSDQYVDGSIDLIHLSADSVDGTKIADDSINSEHYVDGSIDTAHIANSQITLDKMASDSVNSSKIVDGSIVDADINASAAIDATKIADGSVTSTEFQHINTLSSNAQTQLDAKVVKASNLSDLASASTSRTNLGLGTIATQDANNVSVSGGSITGLGSPSASSDAATKNYVDQAVAGLRTRIIAECATTANVNLTNGLEAGDTIDGVTLVAGDRVLVKDQSTASENGLYLAVSSGAASRDPEHDTIAELSGGMVVVNQGSTNDNKIFLCTTDNTGSVGSTSITYSQVTPQNNGTVTSVGIADGGSSEFTVGSSPVTSSGNITLTVNSIAHTKISGLGTAATQTVGTSANNVVQLNGSAQLPAVDGSNLTNLSAASAGFAVAMAIAL
jgi:peptidyl-tRNA hydrolase